MRFKRNLILLIFIAICLAFILAAQVVQAIDYNNSSLHNTLEYLENDLSRYRDQAERTQKQAERYRRLAQDAENEAAKETQEADKKSWLEEARLRRQRAEELEAESAEYLKKAAEKEAEIQGIRDRIDSRDRASERQGARRAQNDAEFNAAREREINASIEPTRPPVTSVLGLWAYGDEDEPFVIVQEDPEFEAYPHKLEAHTPNRTWIGNFNSTPQFGSMIELTYEPKAEEMNPDVPEWARRKVEGDLTWKLEIDMAGTCGSPRLIAAFYPGEIKWKDEGEDDPDGAWVSGKGKARMVTLEKSELDAVYYTYGSPLLYLRLPGPRFNQLYNTVDGLIEGQRFHVDVILPPELADEQGDTLEVTIKGLKGNDATTLQLQRGGKRLGRSVVYTHYDPITIADPLDVQEEDRDAPFLSMNYITGYQGQRIDLDPENGEMIEFSYGEAMQSVPVYSSWVQRKIARHQEAIERLRPFYSMIIKDSSKTRKQKDEATHKLSLIRNYERIMESDELHDYIRARIGSIYFHPYAGLIGISKEDLANQVDNTVTYGQPSDALPDDQRAGTGLYQGVVWTSLYERSTVRLEAAKARSEFINNVLNKLPQAMALALYTGVAGTSGAGDWVTLFTGNDIFGKKVPDWQRVMAAVSIATGHITTYVAPKVMSPPSLKAFSPGHVSSRALRAGARAKLREEHLLANSVYQQNFKKKAEAAMAKMSPVQQKSVMPPEQPAGPPVFSEKPIGCALAGRSNPTSAPAPPPHPGPIDSRAPALAARYGPTIKIKDAGADPLLPPQDFETCQCGSTMLSVKEFNGLALSEMLVFSILVKKGIIKPGVDMPLKNGYKDSHLVALLEEMGAEVMVIPTRRSGRRISFEGMDAWIKKGWRIRDVVKTMDTSEYHAVEIRSFQRDANGDIESVEWYDSAYGEILTGPICDYSKNLASSGFDTIVYRWEKSDVDGSLPAQPTIEPPPRGRPTIEQPVGSSSASPIKVEEFRPYERYDSMDEALAVLYPNPKDAPPLNVVSQDVITKLIQHKDKWQPSDKMNDTNASFGVAGGIISKDGDAMIRIKPGHENFVELIEVAGGYKVRYWKSGVIGEGKHNTYIDLEHLQYVDYHHLDWTDF